MKRFARLLSIAFMTMVLGACSNDDWDDIEPSSFTETNAKHTCKMELVGGINGFDQSTSRATTSSWKNGDKIFIAFYHGTNVVPGEAVYNGENWDVTYEGNLATGTNLKSEARFFVNVTQSTSYLVTLNPNTEIYEDVNAKYSYEKGNLTLYASLSPKTGRIRFTGTKNDVIRLTGITTYATYAPAINQFTTSDAMITTTVATTGSTPYIYGSVASEGRNISIIGSDFAYTRTCGNDVLAVAESGYMAIPTEKTHSNWRTGALVNIGDASLKMLPVAGHEDGFFLMAETETTEKLWNAVNGTYSESLKPVVYVTIGDVKEFISDLNVFTKLKFRLPTNSQWQYAAKGGNKSQGYNYSGSNNPDDVAWYSANTKTLMDVKTKIPNELGLYDMCGNAEEFSATTDGSYYNYPYVLGGSFKSDAKHILPTSNYYLYTSSRTDAIGFRMILKFD